jgi:hypothetical protein
MNYRRPISAMLIPVMLVQLTGCYKWAWIDRGELRPKGEKLKTIEIDGQVVEGKHGLLQREGVRYGISIHFDRESRAVVDRDTLVVTTSSSPYRVGLDRVQSAEARRLDSGKTVALSVFSFWLLVGLALLAGEGGPYSSSGW